MNQINTLKEQLSVNGIEYLAEEPLSKYTSFHIGGNARLAIFPSSLHQLQTAWNHCHQLGISILILGNGSNVLISDEGFDGAAIILGKKFSQIELLDETTIFALSGTSLMKVCRFAAEHSLTGLEFAYGIPASVGGAVYMNAGAYGGEMKDVLWYAEHLTPDGKLERLEGDQLELSYRHSAYSENNCCIAAAAFRLQKGEPEKIRERMEELMSRRKEKQPLEYPSAGSTFKRPQGAFAAQLIEECGLKGRRVGGAQVSEKHSGFLINAGGATCQDVLDLIALVQQEVRKKTGIQLECEVRKIGK